MCEKCDAIDDKIAHYQRLAKAVSDKLTRDRIDELVSEMEAEKSALHPK